MALLLIFLLSLTTAQLSWAHPVTYAGGTVFQTMIREDMSETAMGYSLTPRIAMGAGVDRLLLSEGDTTWGLATFNWLIFRRHGDGSLANLYLLTGGGGRWIREESEWAGKAGLTADYETRRFYIAVQHLRWFSETVESDWSWVKTGFAPFLANYKDLNIWVLAQFDYNRDMRAGIQVTPYLRFFYRNVYWEVGSSLRGNSYAQIMVHF